MPAAEAVRSGFLVQPRLRTQLLVTNNSNFGRGVPAESDLVLDVAPGLTISGESNRLRLDGSIELIGRVFANGTQVNRVLPSGRLAATFNLYERRVFLETGVAATQTLIDPLGARGGLAGGDNMQTSTQFWLTPYAQGELAPGLRYLARSDNTFASTRRYGDVPGGRLDVNAADGYFGHHLLQLEQQPRILGWRLWYERADSRPDTDFAQTDTYELARAALLARVSPQLTVGVRVGVERNNFALVTQQDGSLYGVEVQWRPTERSRAEGWWEERFFGSAWQATVAHRMPWLAFELNSSRELATYQQLLFALPGAGNVASLAGDILTTRIPDAAQRNAVVEDLIARGRLPRSVDGPANVFSDDISRVRRNSARVALLGLRNSLVLSAFRSRTEDLGSLGLGPLFGASSAATNNKQRGAEGVYSLRVSMLDIASLSYSYYDTEGLGQFSSEQSRQRVYRAQWTRLLAPHTSGVAGVLHQTIDFDGGRTTDDETAAFVGITHRF